MLSRLGRSYSPSSFKPNSVAVTVKILTHCGLDSPILRTLFVGEKTIVFVEAPPHYLHSPHNIRMPTLYYFTITHCHVTLYDFRIWLRLRRAVSRESGRDSCRPSIPFGITLPFLWTPRQVERLGFHGLAMARIAVRNSSNKHALSPVSMDATHTGQPRTRTTRKGIQELCSLAGGLCLSVSHHIAFPAGRMVEFFFLCLLMCQDIPQSLVCVRVLIPLIMPCCISLYIRSFNFPLPVFCVLDACSHIPSRFVSCSGTNLQVTLLWSHLQPTR